MLAAWRRHTSTTGSPRHGPHCAAAHGPGRPRARDRAVAGDGHFVVENYIPALQQLPLGEIRHLFTATPTHVGFEEYDIARQVAVSHHYWVIDGELRTFSSPHRYVWPSELDLMACLAGLELRERWSDWHREAFTSESLNHVSVWTTAPARHT